MNNQIAYAEVDAILELLEDEYKKRVPNKIRDFFREEKAEDYNPRIDVQKSLLEQNLQRETFVLLTILELNYWCNSEEEKKELLKELNENEEQAKKELYEKYNPDNIFKTKNEEKDEKQEELALVEYKEKNIFKKIIDKIYYIFAKRNKWRKE